MRIQNQCLGFILISLILVGCAPPPKEEEEVFIPPTANEYYNEGRFLYREGRYQAAIAEFRQAVSLDPSYADAYYWIANAYAKLDVWDQSMNAYKRCLQIRPSYANAHAELAGIYIMKLKYTPAEGHLLQAVKYDPGLAIAYYYLGEIYRKKVICSKAGDNYRKALSIQPDLLDAKEGLRKLAPMCQPKVKKPKYEKADDFVGGAKQLKESEW